MTATYLSRFWSKVAIGDGCWEWQAYRMKNGYGTAYVGGRKRTAHRVAFSLWHGKDPGGKLVCHHCDNRGCVRPSHLYLGSHKDNSSDMVERGRSTKGESHPLARLTKSDVLAIRASKKSGVALAREYGVSAPHISDILSGKKWGHL